jgi:hypothetical protein
MNTSYHGHNGNIFLYLLLLDRCGEVERQGLISPGRVSRRVEMRPQFPATRGPQSSKLHDPLRLDCGQAIGLLDFSAIGYLS